MIISDFNTFINDYGNRLWRILVYKRMFTPYEMDKAYIDETVYEDEWHNVFIEEVIQLPDNDILLGVRTVFDRESIEHPEEYSKLDYYKLSEIRLSYHPGDYDELLEI